MHTDKELDALFAKADAAFAKADALFESAFKSAKTKQETPTVEVHTDHVLFRALNWRERRKLFWRFFKMAFGVLCKGRAQLKFKSRVK